MHINNIGGGSTNGSFCTSCNTWYSGFFHNCTSYPIDLIQPIWKPFLPDKFVPDQKQYEDLLKSMNMKVISAFTTQELIAELIKRKADQAGKIKQLQEELTILESLDFLTGVQSTARGPVDGR